MHATRRNLAILPRTVGVRAAACALLSPEGRHGTSPKAAAGVCSACLDSLSPRKTAASARCRLLSLIRASVPMPNRRAEGPERRPLAGGELEIKVRRWTSQPPQPGARPHNCGCCSSESNGPPLSPRYEDRKPSAISRTRPGFLPLAFEPRSAVQWQSPGPPGILINSQTVAPGPGAFNSQVSVEVGGHSVAS